MRIKTLFISLLSILYCEVSHADYDADDMKKLFTDKSQRAHIDAVRSGSSSGTGTQQTNIVKVSGYVTRGDGKSVVWVNNKNTLDSPRVGNIKVHQASVGKNKKVTVSLDGKSRRLKPGETWHKETGKVVENQ